MFSVDSTAERMAAAVEWGDGAEAGVEEKLGGLGVGGLVGSLLRGGRQGGVDVADEDALAEVGGGGLAKFGGLGVSFGRGADDVEAGDAAVEPEAGYVGQVGGGDRGVEVEQDADVVAAGFVDEVVEIVEGAVGGVDGLGVGGVGLDSGEEDGVGAEGAGCSRGAERRRGGRWLPGLFRWAD